MKRKIKEIIIEIPSILSDLLNLKDFIDRLNPKPVKVPVRKNTQAPQKKKKG